MTIALTGGKDFFCSKGIMTKYNDEPTNDKIKAEGNKYKLSFS